MAGLLKRLARRSKTAPKRIRSTRIRILIEPQRLGFVTELRITQQNGTVLNLGSGPLTISYL